MVSARAAPQLSPLRGRTTIFFELMNDEPQPESNAPKLTAEQEAARQMTEDYDALQQVAAHLEATKTALALKALTPPEQTERHALYDRVINAGGPMIVTGPVWKIRDAPEDPAQAEA